VLSIINIIDNHLFADMTMYWTLTLIPEKIVTEVY